ncbi:pentapeptide repeat-containing protein, partial [Sulfitobacter sp.]|uniref:pentapeptide repeat-containing protein n=1 Tax=Sulfitobacter sp. TaxID=1903071 RepID=UPI003EF28C76
INASFGKGDLNFFGANFGKGDADFYAANFGEGDVNFYGANFEEGNVDFFDANFEEGNVDFDNANLGKGNLDFRFASFGHSKISFVNCACDGMAQFTDLEELEDCTQFSFEGCSFAKLFTFSYDGRMGGPLDLRRTSLSHDVVVNDVKCDFGMERRPSWKAILHAYWTGMPHGAEPYSPWLNRAEDEEDSQRFRKLKELAVANRNHAKALEFHAQEIRAQRGHGTKWWQDLAQFVYWGLSDYGRSVLRPMAALIAAWLSFAAIYFAITKNAAASFGTALTYSGSHMLSFIPTGRTARSQGEAILFGDGENVFVPDWVLGIGAVESVLSVVLLFLFGLGLRNMFRV